MKISSWLQTPVAIAAPLGRRLGALFFMVFLAGNPLVAKPGDVQVEGELKQWHKVTLRLTGPVTSETAETPNPFTDYRFDVTFTHESGSPRYTIPGYFAADGDAANTGAKSGDVWRAHLSPDKPGNWRYVISFRQGHDVAMNGGGTPLAPFDGQSGEFVVVSTDKTGRDFRARGRLEYVGRRYLRFAGTGEYFLKAGSDAPETLLAYADFDDTTASKKGAPIKTWAPHVQDWREGDPTWHGGRGKGLIGAVNYLAGKGLNTMSFLTYNAGGDGDNVWPFVSRDDKRHFDCSKLDQWGVVFDHAQSRGIHLHFKLQENELDDNRLGAERKEQRVPESLDGGALGPERRLYLRELIARFGHALALNWNLGEENTQTTEEQRAMAQYLRENHAYRSNIVLHTFPLEQERVYRPLLGDESALTGASLQNEWSETHAWTLHWVTASTRAGKPWVVANDEQGNWAYGVPPDLGYRGFNGQVPDPRRSYTLHDIRKLTLWGNLMAGGAGVEYYFGYKLPQQDIDAEDFRSRDRSWDFCRYALEFFHDEKIPFWEMESADALVGNPVSQESVYCFAKPGEIYLIYLPWGGVSTIDLRESPGEYRLEWFNPRAGGALLKGSIKSLQGGSWVRLGEPPQDEAEDWLAVLRRQ